MRPSTAFALGLYLLAAPVLAAGPNAPRRSGDAAPAGQHVLSEAPDGALTILYAPSEADDPGFRAAVAAITGGTVDYFDATVGTPGVDELDDYDCVYTWANFPYADNVLFGDNLATYVDGGGVSVLGVFTTYTDGNFLSGQIMTADYAPVSGGSNWFVSSSYAGDGVTPIYDDVSAFECTFRDILTLQGDGVQDGSYLDGEIAHAYNPGGLSNGRVVYSNGAGALQLGCTGDWAQLVANACRGVGCRARLELSRQTVRAGEELVFGVSLEHRRHDAVDVPLTVWIENARGEIVASRASKPFHMEHGDTRRFRESLRLPAELPTGHYSLMVGLPKMEQGAAWARQAFQIVP